MTNMFLTIGFGVFGLLLLIIGWRFNSNNKLSFANRLIIGSPVLSASLLFCSFSLILAFWYDSPVKIIEDFEWLAAIEVFGSFILSLSIAIAVGPKEKSVTAIPEALGKNATPTTTYGVGGRRGEIGEKSKLLGISTPVNEQEL